MKTALKWIAVIALSFTAGAGTLVWMQHSAKANAKARIERMPRHPEAEAMVRQVLQAVGIKADIPVRINKETPCGATVGGTIFLAPRCSQLYEDGHINWHAMMILGHELGHVVNAHQGECNGTPSWQQRDANTFAGFAMGVIGATREDFKPIMMYVDEDLLAGHDAYLAIRSGRLRRVNLTRRPILPTM